MIQNFRGEYRPHFEHPQDWLSHFHECRATGQYAWHPATAAELMLAESAGLLEIHPEWIPGTQGKRLLGLPRWFGRKQPSLSPRWRERFITTLLDDAETLEAVCVLVLGGPSR